MCRDSRIFIARKRLGGIICLKTTEINEKIDVSEGYKIEALIKFFADIGEEIKTVQILRFGSSNNLSQKSPSEAKASVLFWRKDGADAEKGKLLMAVIYYLRVNLAAGNNRSLTAQHRIADMFSPPRVDGLSPKKMLIKLSAQACRPKRKVLPENRQQVYESREIQRHLGLPQLFCCR